MRDQATITLERITRDLDGLLVSQGLNPRTGKYLTGRNVASFAGFFPVPEPKYTILVVLDNPKGMTYGGEVAAPAFREIAVKIINLKGLKPDAPLPPKTREERAVPPISD